MQSICIPLYEKKPTLFLSKITNGVPIPYTLRIVQVLRNNLVINFSQILRSNFFNNGIYI